MTDKREADFRMSPLDRQDTLTAALKVDATTAWLHQIDSEIQPPLSFTRLGNGQSNLTFVATDANGKKFVLRRPPLGHRLQSAHDINREQRIFSALASTGVPVPKVLGYTEDSAICDTPLLAADFVDGEIIDDVHAKALTRDARLRISGSVIETLAQIHAVDCESVGLGDLGGPHPYAARQLHRWTIQWEKSKTRELPIVDHLAEMLTAAIPSQRELTLVHGDYHLLNLVTNPEHHQIRSVLDWELSTRGDPIADLGTLLAYWPQRGELPLPGFADTGLSGFEKHNELLAHYANLTGRDLSSVPFWHALALWKLAIIAEGVRARSLGDPRNTALGGIVTTDVPEVLLTRAQAIAAAIT